MGDYDNKFSTKTQKTRQADQQKMDHSSGSDDLGSRTSDQRKDNAEKPSHAAQQEDTCPEHIECSIEKALDVLGGKWTFLIIRDLFSGTKRFGELRQSLNGVSPKTLSSRLRELERKNIVERRAFATIPPTVKYSLTEKGRSLKPIIKAMKVWGAKWG